MTNISLSTEKELDVLFFGVILKNKHDIFTTFSANVKVRFNKQQVAMPI